MITPTHALANYSSLSELNKFFLPLENRSRDYLKVDKRLARYENDPDLLAKHKQAVYNYTVCRNILSLGDFLYFGGGAKDPVLYLLSPSPLLSSAPIYEKLPAPTLRRLVNACAPDLLVPKQVDDIIKTFLDIPDPNQQISRRIFAISDSLYWDRETASLTDDPAPHRCFFRLFDTRESEKNVPAFPPSTFDSTFSANVQSSYSSLLSVLNSLPDHTFPKDPTPASHPTLPYDFPFILDWADGSYSLYWDLMKILATTFFNKRPDVAYILTGTGYNGKSQYVGLAHTIFGAANTSRAPLSEIGDHHITNSLRFSILNAPDDEGGNKKKDDINSYTKVFKQLASHETLTLPVLYSQTPIDLKADFMCIFPMNMFPRWSGSDVSALTRRTVLVPFTHDFRSHPVHYDNFARETYTPTLLASLVGQLLAIATFYKDKPLTYSSVIDNMAKQVELENDTVRAYLRLFEKYFNGFQSKKTLYLDYVNWVKSNEAGNIVPLSDFRMYWERYLSIPKEKRPNLRFRGVDGQDRRAKVYRIPTPLPHFVLADEFPLKDLGITATSMYGLTIGNAIDSHFSVVDILDKINEEY